MNIGHEAFNLKWHNWIKKDKSLVEFMIIRSQKPLSLTAGKFTAVSLEVFSSVTENAMMIF